MRRLLLLTPLLLTTMGIGPCDSRPLGSAADGGVPPAADGGSQCLYAGTFYSPGSSFPSTDGCNGCSCEAQGTVACTQRACATDAGRDSGGTSCSYGGRLHAEGSTFPSTDGCNSCSCGAQGAVDCTTRACVADAGRDTGRSDSGPDGGICSHEGKMYPADADFFSSDGCNFCSCFAQGTVACTRIACFDGGGGMGCSYGGVVRAVGSSFPSTDGCNSCTCTAQGVACTLRACIPDAGVDRPTGVCTPGQDQTCNDDPRISAIYGVCQPNGTCACRLGALNPMTGRCTAVLPDGGTGGCSHNNVVYPVGAAFGNECGGSCSCTAQGIVCTGPTCGCGLTALYQYGYTGGFVAYEDTATLSPLGTYVYSRVSRLAGSADLCAPPLPVCGGPAIDLTDVVIAIADRDVQAALAGSLFGRDTRPADGTIFQFLHGDGRRFLVGAPCVAGDRACVPPPAGVQRLVSILLALNAQQLRDPACAMLVQR